MVMSNMGMKRATNLLSLPNELLYLIFVYLNSTDLLHAFGQLCSRRMNTLLCAHINHLDFSTADTSVASIEKWLSYLSSMEKKILSLQINIHHFDYSLSLFAKLNRLNLQMTTISEKVSEIRTFTQLRVLSITLTSEKPERLKGLASFIWQSNSCLENLSVSNCFILNRADLLPRSLCSLMINQKLTRLSLDLDHITFAIRLMPFVPALEHFEVRLHDTYNQRSIFTPKFLEKREWPRKVKSLRLIAYDMLMDTPCFCAFVKRFSLSLEHLSFYISIQQRYLMSTHGKFEHSLLDHLPHLKQMDFCVYNGLMNVDIDRRKQFDDYTKRQVISVFHQRRFHTRFTLPFTFDRLEHVSNEFVDYHCNFYQSNTILSLPSIVKMTFHSRHNLNLGLFTFVQRTCPSLRYLCFQKCCNLDNDLIQDTELMLPTVRQLYFNDIISYIDSVILHRLFSLIPNLMHLTAQQRNITAFDVINNTINLFGHIIKVTIVERSFQINNK